MGGGTSAPVLAFGEWGDDMVVGGRFLLAGGTGASRVGIWDGFNWSNLGSGANDEVRAVSVDRGSLVIGGAFIVVGGLLSNYIAMREPDPTSGVPEPRTVSPGLLQPAPNPFRAQARIAFVLEHAVEVTLSIYDPAGRRVRILSSSRFEAGPHTVAWDGVTDWGASAKPGLYFVVLEAGGARVARKLLRIE
jgi:hypothetical protein